MMALRPRRLLRWTLWLLLVLAVLFAAALFIAPRLLDVPVVRAELERQVSKAVQGQVSWDELQVRLFPVPHGILRGARIEIPKLVTGRVDVVEVDLRLRALLMGQVEVSGVRVVRPVFRVTIAPSPPAPKTPSPPTPDPVSAYRQAMEPVVKALRAVAADMTLSIDNADVSVEAPGVPLSLALDLSVRGHTDSGGVDLSATASGSIARQLTVSARVNYSDLRARATVDAVDLKPQALLDLALAGTPVSLQLPSANLHAEINCDGHTVLKVTATADAPALAVVLQKSRLDLDSVRAEAAIVLKGRDVDIVLSSVRAGELLPAGSAKLFFPAGNDPSEFSASIPALDLARVRDAVLAIAGDIPAVRTYVGAVKGGRATDVTFSSRALSAGDWFDPRVFTASLELGGVAMLAPVIARDVTDVSGRADWNSGTLGARSVAGKLGSARIIDGSFDYQLADGTMNSAAGYDIDLREALDLVRRSLAPAQRSSLDSIRSLTGRAQGRFGFRLLPGQWSAELGIARSDAALRLRDVPWPVSLRGGHVKVTPKRLIVAGASGAVGQSTFNQVGANLATDGPMRIEAAQGNATLALGELYQWLRTQKGLEASLRDIPTVTGKADVTVNRVAGHLDALDALDYDVSVQPRQVLVEMKDLPAPATGDGGSIRITPATLKIGGVNVALLDLRARVSGLVADYRTRALQADMAVADGMVDEKFMKWVWERGKIPARFEPALPIGFTVSRARWSKAAGLDLQANLRSQKGASIDADMAFAGDVLNVRSVRIRDAQSDATLGLLTRGRLLDTSFSGKLTGQTVASLFKADLGKRPGSVTGNMRATLDRDMRRGRTTAQGKLSGQQIDLRWVTGKPITVSRIELDADGNQLRVGEATLDWAEQQATVRGNVRFTPGGPVIDAQVDSPGIVVDALLPPRPEATSERAEPSPKKTPEALEIWPLPVTGTLNVRAGFIEYQRYRVEPVAAKLVLEPERARMTATEAAVCGISFPFSLDVTPQGTVASVALLAKDQELGTTTRCLTSERVLLTGTYNLRADLRTHGRPDDFVMNLEGSVSAEARAGKVMKFALLGNILALKDVARLFSQDRPDLSRAGFPYRTIVARGRFAGGTFTVEQGAFDSEAVGIAATGTIGLLDRKTRMTVLVAPFSKLDRLARSVPLFGYIFGGALTSIPVGVSGDIRNPLVVPLGPGAVTGELVGIFQRTLKLPSKMLEPLQQGVAPTPPPAAPAK